MQTNELQLKYNIYDRLKKMPGTVRTNYYKLCIHFDISLGTLKKWAELTKEEKYSIPVDQFYQLAEYFNCKPDELFNNG